MRPPTLLLATTLCLAACGSIDRPGGGRGTFIFIPAADAADLFPPFVSDLTGRMVQDQVFDRLAEIDSGLNTIGDAGFSPRLARSWTWAPDSLSIAFAIDPRARWHDGKPVTARDVRYSFDVYVDSVVGSPTAPLLANIDSVSVRDSLTAVAWFHKRTPEQFYDIAYQLIIFPEHVYGVIPRGELHTDERTRTPIGSGRFRFVSWEPGVRIELVADTANYRGRPSLDRVIITPTDANVGAARMLAGAADFQDAFPIDRTPALDSSDVARGMDFPNFGYAFMAMNAFDPADRTHRRPHPVLGDVRVRRALAMAVDREGMLHNVFGGRGLLSHGPFPMSVPYADSAVHPQAFDTVAARALLDSAGWRVGPDGIRARNGRPLRFTIMVPNTSVPRQRYAVLLQAQLQRIGARVDLDISEIQNILGHMRDGDFDALLAGFVTDPSPTTVRQNWGTAGIGPTGQNFLRYSSPRVDALLDSTSASFDPAQRKAYAARAFRAIIDDAPAIFLYDITVTRAVNRRFTLAPMRVDEWWANLADWSVPPGNRIDRDRIGLRPAAP